MTFDQYRSDKLRITQKRFHKIKNSYGIKDAYSFYVKNSRNPIQYKVYASLIKEINSLLVNTFLQGNDIVFPYGLGKVSLLKYRVNGKYSLIDWNRTLDLWYKDKESEDNKAVVKLENKEVYKITYSKKPKSFTNQQYIMFRANRDLKQKVKQSIVNNEIDAFLIDYGK